MGFDYDFLKEIEIGSHNIGCYVGGKGKANGPTISTLNPATNQPIAEVVEGSIGDYEEGMKACVEASKMWKQLPALKGGDIVRKIGDALRANLGRLVSLEMGKILPEGIGEIQEIIDMCD